jgi:hypothetical protein
MLASLQNARRRMNTLAKQTDTPAPVLMDAVETCRFFGGANSPLNPIKLGAGTSRWLLGECQEKLRELMAERDGEA